LELNLIEELIDNMKAISPADFEELILKHLAKLGMEEEILEGLEECQGGLMEGLMGQ
tara:strand:- start:116 stop:286 length:171 start_codon:yes stop_codon:yes gene_type:complete